MISPTLLGRSIEHTGEIQPVVWDNKSRVAYMNGQYVGIPEGAVFSGKEVTMPETEIPKEQPRPPSYVIWENINGLNRLHGRIYGDSVEHALDSLATTQTYREGETVKHCTDMNDWFQKKGTNLSKFKFEQVQE